MEEIRKENMKSLGRVGYEHFCEESFGTQINWIFLDQSARDAWESTAQAIVEEHEQRKPDDDDETPILV